MSYLRSAHLFIKPYTYVLLIFLLVGCARVGPSVVLTSSPTDAGASTTQTALAHNQTLAPCLVTKPNGETPPGENPSSTFYGNGSMWTDLRPDGNVIIRANQPGNIGAGGSLTLMWPWWHSPTGQLTIEGRRLDAPAAPLRADIQPRFDVSSFDMSNLTFPTPGCWEITGRVGQASLTFVTQVVLTSP